MSEQVIKPAYCQCPFDEWGNGHKANKCFKAPKVYVIRKIAGEDRGLRLWLCPECTMPNDERILDDSSSSNV